MTAGTRYPRVNLAAGMLSRTGQFKLDVGMLEQHVRETIGGGCRNLHPMGAAGEGYAATDALFKEIVGRFARLTVKPGLDPQIGVIALSDLYFPTDMQKYSRRALASETVAGSLGKQFIGVGRPVPIYIADPHFPTI